MMYSHGKQSGFTLLHVVALISFMGMVLALNAKLTADTHVENQIYMSKLAIDELKAAYSDYYAGQCSAFLNAPSISTLKSQGYLATTFNESIPNAGPITLGASKNIDNMQVLSINLTFDTPAFAKYAWNEMSGEGIILSDKRTYQISFFPYVIGERGASYTWFSSSNCP
ncbi:hypothetical protein [Shewanella aestuarii]|uniref:Uncharacterized protein n=1 Tax=Shewanella aestuarii TaxID=1028752 RepID=A0A6G9QRX8_9GAMM|nr:hypothetical protein [Shewanella aestuarii]QIR16541.1 hypothetical protein HBH39_18880 [Shewanella aestuarii]